MKRNIPKLWNWLAKTYHNDWEIVIAANGPPGPALAAANDVAHALPAVRVLHVPEPGRGWAVTLAWRSAKEAAIVSYMDIDLATDLDCFNNLVNALYCGDIAIGNRFDPRSAVRRGIKREIVSRCYRMLVRLLLGSKIDDFQCGFKAAWRWEACRVLHSVSDRRFFWDTEFLVKAERIGMRIMQVPVKWTDQPSSTVRIAKTAGEDLQGIMRLRHELRGLATSYERREERLHAVSA